AIKSDYFLTYLFRGMIYSETGDMLSALADFNRAIGLNPDAFEPYFMRGVTYYFSGRADDALSDLEQSIALNPDIAPAYSSLGNVYADQGGHDDAVAQFSKAIDLDPVWASSYFNRANSYSALWEYRLALHDYDKAIELDPWFFEAYIGRGLVYTERGNFDEAIADFDSALAINPDEPISIYNKAIAYSLLHQDEAAVGAYREFVRAAPPRYPDEVGIAKEAIAELEIAAVWVTYFLPYAGVGFHKGSIEEIGDDYQIPSTPANDIYKTSPQFGLVVGARRGMLMVELSLEGGLLWLTDSAQAAIDSVYGDEYKMSSGFISAEVTLGPTYRVRLYPFRQYLRIYGAVSGGLLIQPLYFESEMDTDFDVDFGFGAALKAGLDYTLLTLLKDRSVFVRLGTRYQVLAEGVGVPRTFTVFLGVGIRI
ncbi:MAG: tetratricopeptide repeat protein, partial [Candidatus Krumholzibacteria bacterium]|nr:tetratricopeptide repeat protein [Candidatus Krumholzibacteria bacterium]